MEVLRAAGKDGVRVAAEGFVKSFPAGYEYAVLAGRDEMTSLLEGRDVDVDAMEEGTLFFPGEPVFTVEGPYGAFCEMETAMLGMICQASGIATASARVKHAAGDRQVLSFGARRMHPALSTMIDRNAFIGGVDGVSVVRSAEFLGEAPLGTMPHALILLFGDTVEAMRAFDAAVDPSVPRVCLIDTLRDEKFEALRVAEALRERLAAVRLDTPASRRGNFRRILQEVRWELDLRGFRHVQLIASGGLREEEVRELRGHRGRFRGRDLPEQRADDRLRPGHRGGGGGPLLEAGKVLRTQAAVRLSLLRQARRSSRRARRRRTAAAPRSRCSARR